MDSSTTKKSVQGSIKRNNPLGVVLRLTLALTLVVSLTPITKAYAEEEASQAQLLGLKLETSDTSQGVIEGIVFVDANANGELDNGEAPVKDCKVTYGAPEEKTSVYDEVKTDEHGKFTFSDVADGSYTVRIASQMIDSEMYVSTYEANSTDPVEDDITLEAPIVEAEPEPEAIEEPEPAVEPELEAEEALLALEEEAVVADSSISGILWLDTNEDGMFDEDETAIENYPVDLYQDGIVTQSTVTDSSGAYSFESLTEGDYKVGVQAQKVNNIEYLIPIKMLQSGADNIFDADFSYDPVVSLSGSISLAADTQIQDINAGMRGGQEEQVAPMAGTTITINTNSYTLSTTNLQTILTTIYPVASDITAATTLKFTGNGPITLGASAATASITYLNSLNIDTIDLSSYSGTLSQFTFNRANSIQTVILGTNITSLPMGAFAFCSSLTTFGGTQASVATNPGIIDLASTNVNAMDVSVFRSGSSITTVALGTKVTVLPQYAFSSCPSLTTLGGTVSDTVSAPNVIDLSTTGLLTLDTNGLQFQGCTSVTTVIMGTVIPSLPRDVFSGCSKLTTLGGTYGDISTNPNIIDLSSTNVSLLEVGYNSTGHQFDGCSSIRTVVLGKSITSLPQAVFQGCSSLTTLGGTFADITSNPNIIDLSSTNVTTFGVGYQFSQCSSMTTVVLGNKITTLPKYAFSDCTSLATFTASLADINGESQGFIDFKKLSGVTLDSAGYQFSGCKSTIAYIGSNAMSLPIQSFRQSTVFVPKTISAVTLSGANVAQSGTLYVRGPQATSPTTVTNPANAPTVSYYLESKARTDGNGTITANKSKGGFLPDLVEEREVTEGNLVSGANYARQGINITYTITPKNSNYSVKSITANGIPITSYSKAGNDYTFTGITEDTEFYVTFDGPPIVTYDDTNSTGNTFEDPTVYFSGGVVTVLDYEDSDIVAAGFAEPTRGVFAHWNTAADGSGTTYEPGQAFSITGDVTLYAIYGLYRVDGSSSGYLGTFMYLQDAMDKCTATGTGETYTISALGNDADMGAAAVSVPSGFDVTLTSWGSAAYTITQKTADARHLFVDGTLDMQNLVLDGSGVGGGIDVNSLFTMNSGGIIQNCVTSGAGGGVCVLPFASFDMNSGIITGNDATSTISSSGGGVDNSGIFTMNTGSVISDNIASQGGGVQNHGGATFTMNGGDITGNTGTECAGGIYDASSSFAMHGGAISNNKTTNQGGGIVFVFNDPETITGGVISNNEAKQGGGIWLASTGDLSLQGGSVTSNKASEDGGGIYVQDYDYANPANVNKYANIGISSSVTISGNTSGMASDNPSNANDFTIRGTNPFDGTLLNNDQINYKFFYDLTYKGNNGKSEPDYLVQVPVPAGGIATPVAVDNLSTTSNFTPVVGATFDNKWNTQANGSGTDYAVGATITMTGDTTVYAQWDYERYLVYKDADMNELLSSHHWIADAVFACGTGTGYTIVATEDDPDMTNTAGSVGGHVTIPSGKSITLTSDAGGPYALTQLATSGVENGARHFWVAGSNAGFTIKNIVLEGSALTAGSDWNGGIHVAGGNLTMESGATIQDCYNNAGGGVDCRSGNFIMNGGKISGNISASANQGGGGVYFTGSSFTMYDGEISGNKASSSGGGVALNQGGVFTLAGGSISGNTAPFGGGISVPDGELVITGGKVVHNAATSMGGGISATLAFDGSLGTLVGTGKVKMSGGEISNNTAGIGAGGVYLAGIFEMTAGTISDNSSVDGGGVYIISMIQYGNPYSGFFDMSGGSLIDNVATNDGGGIFTLDYDYANPANVAKYGNITITGGTISGNMSAATDIPPTNAADFGSSTKRGALGTFDGDLLDNDQINYENPGFTITYDDNHSSATYDDTGYSAAGTDTATVLTVSATGLNPPTAAYELDYWCTDPSGTGGTNYNPGNTFTVTDHETLYAIWKLKTFSITEKYHANQSGTPIDIVTYPDVATTSINYGTAISQANLNGKIKTIPGWTYSGYILDGGSFVSDALKTGPTIASLQANAEIRYVYTQDNYTVTYHLVDRTGTDIAVSGTFEAPGAEMNKHYNDTFGPTTPTSGTPVNYIYVGWNTDGSGVPTNTGTITGTVTANTDVYLVYGTDGGTTGDDDDDSNPPDGKEDVVVTRHHIKATDGAALTGILTPIKKIQNLEDSPYTDAHGGVSEQGWTYAGWNTTGSNTVYNTTPVSVALTAGTDVDVYYVYTQNNYTVTYHLVDRSGTDISVSGTFMAPTAESNKHYNDTYGPVTAPSPGILNYVYAGWNTDNLGGTNTAAISGTVTGDIDVYLVYGTDGGTTGDDDDDPNPPDGKEDVVVTRHHIKATDGTALTGTLSPIKKVQNLEDSPYTDGHGGVTELGWTYAGWNTTGSNTVYSTAPVSIALVANTNVAVYYVYTQNNYTVTYHLVDRSGTDISVSGTFDAPSAESNKHYNDTYGTVTPPSPGTLNYVYAGWNTDNLGGTNTAAITGTVTSNVDVYLVYGTDGGTTGDDDDDPNPPDGLEDVVVTRHHIKATDGTALTGTLTPIKKVQNLVDSPYTDAHGGVTEPGWTYAGWNTTGSNTVYSTAPVSVALTANTNVNVYYVYTQNSYTVTYHLVDRSGTDISVSGTFDAPTAETNKHYNDTYGPVTAPSPGTLNYVYAGWNTDNLGGTNTAAITGTVTGSVDVYLVYGTDGGTTGDDDDDPNPPDGLEDVVVTRHHIKATDGTALTGTLTPIKKIQNLVDSPYTDAHGGVSEQGWTYAGWNTTGSNTVYSTAPVSVALTANTNVDVYYVYTQNNYTVTYRLVDRSGTDISVVGTFQAPSAETNKHYNDTFGPVSAPSGIALNYVYVGWNTDNLGGTNTSTITGTVTGNTDVYLVYGADKGDTGDDADIVNPPDGLEDVTVIRHHIKATDGTNLTGSLAPTKKIQNLVDSPYTDAHGGVAETGWTYAGWNTTGSNTTYNTTPVSVALTGGTNVDVYYVYTQNTYSVTYHLVNRSGANVAASGFTAPPTQTGIATNAFSTPVTAPNGAPKKLVYVGWNTNGSGNPVNGAAVPITTQVTANTDIYLVYGQDKGGDPVTPGPDGIEDVTITVVHQTQLGGKIVADKEVYVNIGDTFTGNALTSSAYTLVDTKWDGTSLGAVTPYVETNVTTVHRIVFVYSPNAYPVTVAYEHEDGTSLSGPNQNTTINHGTVFIPTVPSMTDLCLVNWKLNGVPQNNKVPKVTVTQYADIVLIYAQDKNHDGKKDVTITENCYCESGTHLHGPREVYVNVGEAYNGQPCNHAGHTYASFKVNAGATKTGQPKIARVSAPAQVDMNYAHNNYQVSVKHVDTNGSGISGNHDYSQTVAYQSSWSMAAGNIAGYTYQGWQVGGGALQAGDPSIASMTEDVAVNLVYKANATPTPAPDPDYGNYDFVKMPNVKNVAAGETVNYTFANFGNKWPFDVERYSITDKPDRGLDFQWANLPAFNNGAGVTYNVVFFTSNGAKIVAHSNISAASPFSFGAPSLSAGEYITAIEIEFGSVPSGFAVDDTLQMTFKVWDNPPAQTLTNVGILSYKVGDEYKQFVTGDSGMVVIGGWFSGLAKMGDSQITMTLAFVIGVSFAALALALAMRRRARRNKI